MRLFKNTEKNVSGELWGVRLLLPAFRAVPGDCQWPFKKCRGGGGHMSPEFITTEAFHNFYLDQPITKWRCQSIEGHVLYPTDSPTPPGSVVPCLSLSTCKKWLKGMQSLWFQAEILQWPPFWVSRNPSTTEDKLTWRTIYRMCLIDIKNRLRWTQQQAYLKWYWTEIHVVFFSLFRLHLALQSQNRSSISCAFTRQKWLSIYISILPHDNNLCDPFVICLAVTIL